MATLNIKNLPDALYKKLRSRAKRHHRSLSKEVTHILSEAVQEPVPLSIQELRGLGKEYWTGIDAAAYIEGERRSWD